MYILENHQLFVYIWKIFLLLHYGYLTSLKKKFLIKLIFVKGNIGNLHYNCKKPFLDLKEALM